MHASQARVCFAKQGCALRVLIQLWVAAGTAWLPLAAPRLPCYGRWRDGGADSPVILLPPPPAQGEMADCMYFVAEGVVRIVDPDSGRWADGGATAPLAGGLGGGCECAVALLYLTRLASEKGAPMGRMRRTFPPRVPSAPMAAWRSASSALRMPLQAADHHDPGRLLWRVCPPTGAVQAGRQARQDWRAGAPE